MNGSFQKIKGFSFFNTFKHSSVYFIGTLLTQALGLLSLPIYLFFLTKAEYGIVSIFLSYVNIVSVILSLNLHLSIGRYFHEKDADLKSFVSTIFIATFFINLAFGIPIFIFRESIGALINLPPNVILYLLLTGYVGVIYYIFFQLKREEKKSREVSILSVFWQYIKFGCSIVGMYWLSNQAGQAFFGKIVGELVGSLFFAFIFILRIWKFLDFKIFIWEHLRYAIRYSIPLIPYSIGGYLLNSFDQWYINSELGNEEAGLYSFAYKVGMLLLGLISALHSAGNPDYNQWMNKKFYDKVSSQALSIHKLTILGGLFLLLFSVDAGSFLLNLINKPDFLESLSIIPPITGGYVFYGWALLYSRGINYFKVNIYLTLILVGSGLINILLNAYYIPDNGYSAAAYTTFASYLFMMLLSWVITHFWLKFPALAFGRMWLASLPIILVAFIYYYFNWDEYGLDWRLIILKLVLFGVSAIFLFWNSIKKIIAG